MRHVKLGRNGLLWCVLCLDESLMFEPRWYGTPNSPRLRSYCCVFFTLGQHRRIKYDLPKISKQATNAHLWAENVNHQSNQYIITPTEGIEQVGKKGNVGRSLFDHTLTVTCVASKVKRYWRCADLDWIVCRVQVMHVNVNRLIFTFDAGLLMSSRIFFFFYYSLEFKLSGKGRGIT